MKLAFVLRLGDESRPSEGRLEGWIQEVDTWVERRFRSTEELLSFLGQRFDLVKSSAEKDGPDRRSKK